MNRALKPGIIAFLFGLAGIVAAAIIGQLYTTNVFMTSYIADAGELLAVQAMVIILFTLIGVIVGALEAR